MEFKKEEPQEPRQDNLHEEPEATMPEQPVGDEVAEEEKETEMEPGKTISRRKAILTGLASAGAGAAMGAALFSSDSDDGTSPAGSPFDPTTAPVATGVTDEMSFGEAFAAARTETGPGGVFQWHGQYYHTFVAQEVDDHGVPQVEYVTVEQHPLPALTPYHADEHTPAEVAQGPAEHPATPQPEAEPVQQEDAPHLEPHVVDVDVDGDGLADAQYIDVNNDGVADGVLTDVNHDGNIGSDEVEWINNPETLSHTGEVDTGAMAVDADHNGIPEIILEDADNDNMANVLMIDSSDESLVDIDVEAAVYAPPDVYDSEVNGSDQSEIQPDRDETSGFDTADFGNDPIELDDIG